MTFFLKSEFIFRECTTGHRGGRDRYLRIMTEHVWVLEGDSYNQSMCDKSIMLCGGRMYVWQWGLLRRRNEDPVS